MKKPIFMDIASLDEDARIDVIANTVTPGKTIGFVVNSDPGKAQRYIRKLKEKNPLFIFEGPLNGPKRGMVTVKVTLPIAGAN